MRSRRVSTTQGQSTLLPSSARARPENTTADQAHVSNQGIQQALRAGTIQAKLSVSQPGDRLEQEADRVAESVMRMPASTRDLSQASGGTPSIQRMCTDCEEEIQRKPVPSTSHAETGYRPPGGPGLPLPSSERGFFEIRFHRDFSDVRIHRDSQAADAADAINARAFTVGQNIVFGTGQYQPHNAGGQHLLAHELTHVLQQSGGSEGVSQSQPLIQRGIGDGHDLQSPWLAGDLRLEDIFDNTVNRFLRNGSTGESVRRVQQLLFFLGFDIGVEGADGIFGPHTEAGVRAFQTRFAPPVDGIIGPITIGALDRQANQSEANRVVPNAPPGGPPVGTPPAVSVDRIDIVDSAAGAIGGYGPILGNASLNNPGPFNDPTEVKNVHQIHFHLDNGNSADLTPLREVQATATIAGAVTKIPPDEILPPGFVGPPRGGGFDGILIGRDGPGLHEIQRPTADTIVIADAPGPRGLVAANFPITFRAHFILTVNDARNAPIARITYDVFIDRRSQADVPNTENRITATSRRDFVRGRPL